MDIREKLIELLGKNARCPKEVSTCHDCPYWADDVGCYEDEATADMLIANNVTVQEWISVEDRLPAYVENVIVYDTREGWIGCARLQFDRTWATLGFDWPLDFGEVTHWMPLPEAPKGE